MNNIPTGLTKAEHGDVVVATYHGDGILRPVLFVEMTDPQNLDPMRAPVLVPPFVEIF